MRNEKSKIKYNYVVYGIYALLSFSICFLLFYNLGNNSVENWDEARHGISAYEMLKNDTYMINTFNYTPDLWNLKPPLSFWTEAISFSVFGYNLFAFRLPSVIASLLTFFSVSIFLHKQYGYKATISFMILFQLFNDIIVQHCYRSGDADALFLLFFVLSTIFLYYSERKIIYLYLSGLMFSLAFLSKSFHAFSILGIIVLYVVLSGIIKKLKFINYVTMFFSTFGLVAIWAVLRYCNDGLSFLGSMFGVDVVNRVSDSSKNANGMFYFLKYMLTYKPIIMIEAIIIICSIYLFVSKKINVSIIKRHDFILFGLCIFINFVIYNLSKSTLSWYYYPTFITMIIVASILIEKVIKFSKDFIKKNKLYKLETIITYALVIGIFGVFSAVGIRSYFMSNVFNPSINDEQSAIIELSQDREIHSDTSAYILKDSNSYMSDLSKWEQADILVAELYGDWRCKNGGIDSFTKESKESVLLISKKQYDKNKEQLNKYNIVKQNSKYYLLNNL